MAVSLAPEDLLASALKLSVNDRARIARELLVSLDEGNQDPDAHVLWTAELRKRAEDVLRGNAKLVDAEEVDARVEARLKALRTQR